MRDKFIFYRSFFESLDTLPKTTRLKLLESICDYALNGKEPIGLNVSTLALFKVIKSSIDASQKSYDSKVKNGRLGGAPKGNSNASKQHKTTENNLIQPNSTENNLIIEENIREDNIKEVRGIEENIILGCFPTLAEILVYASELEIEDKEYCEKFYNYYGSIGWVNGTGQQIKNWKLVFVNWCKKDGLLKKENNSEIDTETIYEDEFGRYRINENGKRVVC